MDQNQIAQKIAKTGYTVKLHNSFSDCNVTVNGPCVEAQRPYSFPYITNIQFAEAAGIPWEKVASTYDGFVVLAD